MVTKERLKTEIDKVQDVYLDVLYRIIQVFEYAPPPEHLNDVVSTAVSQAETRQEWHTFITKTYGCLTNDPIERGEQGIFEVREALK